jgi:hypothetical protein
LVSAPSGERSRSSTCRGDHDNPPVIVFNEKRRAILAEGINEAVLDSPEKRQALAEVLAQDPPRGWAHLPLMATR